jgi:hypothetical protein
MDIGFGQVGSVHLELIQPLEGNPQMDAFLAEADSGLHHLRFTVDDLDQAVADFHAKGYKLLACGRGAHAGSRWAYFDTRAILNGLIIELRSCLSGESGDAPPWLSVCFENK